MPSETWQHYHAPLDKGRAETLTPDAHATFIVLSDQKENGNVNIDRESYYTARAEKEGKAVRRELIEITIPESLAEGVRCNPCHRPV